MQRASRPDQVDPPQQKKRSSRVGIPQLFKSRLRVPCSQIYFWLCFASFCMLSGVLPCVSARRGTCGSAREQCASRPKIIQDPSRVSKRVSSRPHDRFYHCRNSTKHLCLVSYCFLAQGCNAVYHERDNLADHGPFSPDPEV